MKFDLVSVPKAKNLHLIAWTDGYVMVQFKGKPDRWIYGPAIPQDEVAKILRVPYPDKIFTSNIRNKYRAHKVGS